MKRDKTQELNELITDLASRCKLDNWNQFTEEVKVPAELLPALMSGRTELLKLVPPRALTAEEAAAMYKLVAVLMETNAALKEHAEQLALFTQNWADAFKHLHSLGNRIKRFAMFDHRESEDE